MKSFAAHLDDCRSLDVRREPIAVEIVAAEQLELAETILATQPFPSFAASSMDGYAVQVADLPGRLVVIGEVAAGHVPDLEVTSGRAVRIMTGGAIPIGTEAVVPVEDALEAEGIVRIEGTTTRGRFIRFAGEDVQIGDVVLTAGQRMGPAQLAALAAHGRAKVLAYPRPRIAVISTGDELVSEQATVGPAQLRDSNGPGLAAAVRACGAEVACVKQTSDDVRDLIETLDQLTDVDLIITSGGISMGTHDVVKEALADLGITFEAVAMQPGKPQGWGRFRGRTAFLGLPGNPVSALTCFEIFGRAALRCEHPIATAILLDEVVDSPPDKLQLLRGWLTNGTVQVVSGAGSHLIAGMARANCLIVIEQELSAVAAGSSVKVMPI